MDAPAHRVCCVQEKVEIRVELGQSFVSFPGILPDHSGSDIEQFRSLLFAVVICQGLDVNSRLLIPRP